MDSSNAMLPEGQRPERRSLDRLRAAFESDDDDEGEVLGTGFLDSEGDMPVDVPNVSTQDDNKMIPRPVALQVVDSIATVRASNTQRDKHQRNDSLSDLFDAPLTPPKNEPNRPPTANSYEYNKSAMSNGLPPPSRNLPRPKPVQDRTVSWDHSVLNSPAGFMTRNNNESTKNPILSQPSLGLSSKDVSSQSPPRTTIDWGDFREMSPPRPRTLTAGSTSTRRINLGQLVNEASPLESEAETHILLELEQRAPNRGRANTGTSSLLSGVPDDSIHNFGLSKQGSTMQITPPTSEQFSDTASSNAPLAPSEPGNRSFHSSGNSGGEPLARMPSSRPPLRGGGTKLQPAMLKRNRTIEETLFGLESTMRAIHDDENQDFNTPEEMLIPSSGGGRPRLFSNDVTQPAPKGSADALAQNANALFSRPVPKKMVSERPGGPKNPYDSNASMDADVKKNPSRWNLFSDTSNHSKSSADRKKKTDDLDVDVEIGGLPPPPPPQSPIPEVSSGSNQNPHESASSSKRKTESKVKPDGLMEKADYEFVNDFLKPRQASIIFYCKTALFYLMIPATGVAAILYYLAQNPPTGKAGPNGERIGDQNVASASWWILFVCVRQVITFSLARATEGLVIDFLCLRTRWALKLFGPVLTLFIVQSKGWPFTLFSWALFDYALLQGPRAYASHWLCWQKYIGLFNKSNPAGEVVRSVWNKRALAISVSLGIVVAVKRLMLGLYLGRQTFAHYGEELAQLMSKMILVSQVAALGRQLEKAQTRGIRDSIMQPTQIPSWSLRSLMDDTTENGDPDPPAPAMLAPPSPSGSIADNVIDPCNRDPYTGTLKDSERIKILQLLDEWEEPERRLESPREITISAVLQFRRALDFMDIDFPFSISFGLADTREACIESSQEVYHRLLSATPGSEILHFNTIALAAADRNGALDRDKLKDLVRLFRPERDGNLSMLDFVKSVDSVYKSMRLLRATIENSSQIDHAFENIFNVFFYITVFCVVLAQIGFNPHAIYLSLSSFILAFAFMIGSASAKYFDGLLFILVQRPYGIGDRIHVASAQTDSSSSGAQGWIVENVTLFKTTVRLGATNERATISNGALAGSRIINASRSPKALLYINLKFGVDIPYERIQIFKSVVERFVKARPREWVAMSGFRSSQVAADLGFIQYVITVQHRESWQNITQLLQSQSDLSCFCLEVSKKMGMRYISPPLPVNLAWNQPMPATMMDGDLARSLQDKDKAAAHHQQTDSMESGGFQDIAALFENKE